MRAKNFYTNYYGIGDQSPWSPVATFYSSDLPLTVSELTFTDRTQTDATIHWVHHEEEASKGYSTIDLYYLLWVDDCQGGAMTNLLVNSTTQIEYTISNIPPGSYCRFRMKTLNIIGYSSSFSPSLTVLFASIPDPPNTPTYVARSGGDIVTGLEPFITISWEEPVNNGGVDILGYLVKLSQDGGEWILAYDGSVEPDIRQFKF